MNLSWLKNLFKNTVFFTVLTSTTTALAQTFDYSLLIGEWSQPGMCDTERYVYTNEGKYLRLEKPGENNLWQTTYEGVYVVKPEGDLVVIAEGMQEGGFGFLTQELTSTRYVSQESIPGENEPGGTFEYEKCPSQN